MGRPVDPSALQCYGDSEAAALLGCSPRHVKSLRLKGTLPYVRIGRRSVIRHCHLVAFLEAHQARVGGVDAS